MTTGIAAVILAAGQGTRMKSALPKVLHPLGGRPLVRYSVAAAEAVTGGAPVLVVGHGAEQVRAAVGDRARYVLQAEQLGTGHAVLQAAGLLAGQADAVLVTYADMPLLTQETLRLLVDRQAGSGAALTLLTLTTEDPRGFGRIVRDVHGRVRAVVEEADCTPEQRAIRELNTGVYCFDGPWLWSNLPRLAPSRKGEYYLTDMVALAVTQGRAVNDVVQAREDELLGINTRVHLAEAEQALRRRINRRWMEAGVTMVDPDTTYVEPEVAIGADTVLWPDTHLRGHTVVGAGCRIGPGTVLTDCRLGDGCAVMMSVLEGAVLEPGSHAGPYLHQRKE